MATVELSDPGRRNALSADMFADLARTLPELDDDPGVRVVVLTGAGEDFCSGADLSAVSDDAHPLGHMNRINRAAVASDRARLSETFGAGAPGRPGRHAVGRPGRAGRRRRRGAPDAGTWAVGQCQGLIHDIPAVGELIPRIVAEAEAVLGRLSGLLPISA
ncbi:enoyl-CoA hydratase/isomerase family protein [Pseudonocardia sp. ICBG1142]|uniref:enoyl-CoA hydratase/isomerase family protein n=1 Tax=Pseudonocardia sp. ICBG1142 TaxID=2846760 RepID=UPI0027E05772|nr:enoyl-CoA hydratase/isomerase family protein [Pseudonocardia sp. ICBG1142]